MGPSAGSRWSSVPVRACRKKRNPYFSAPSAPVKGSNNGLPVTGCPAYCGYWPRWRRKISEAPRGGRRPAGPGSGKGRDFRLCTQFVFSRKKFRGRYSGLSVWTQLPREETTCLAVIVLLLEGFSTSGIISALDRNHSGEPERKEGNWTEDRPEKD